MRPHATEATRRSEARAHTKLIESENHVGNRDFILDYRLSGDRIHSGILKNDLNLNVTKYIKIITYCKYF
ncbi:MAG: hypothetical protein PVJ19_17490 [Desulfobacteraceae bacterium]